MIESTQTKTVVYLEDRGEISQKSGSVGHYGDTEHFSKLGDRKVVVCRVELEDGSGGTGFLIGKNLILTNNHVIGNIEAARKAKALFFHTTATQKVEVNLNPERFFYTSETPDRLGFKPTTAKALDFTIVAIEPHPKIADIAHHAFSLFDMQLPKEFDHANIIHHPLENNGTTYQKISFRDNLIREVQLFALHYTTSTKGGSSGSPVMDDQGNLIALHRASCPELLKALLENLDALLKELFPNAIFTEQEATFEDSRGTHTCPAKCATIDGAPLYVFYKDELKGKYIHQGKMLSPAYLDTLIAQFHQPAKTWAIAFLKRQGVHIEDYHRECNIAVPMQAIYNDLKKAGHIGFIQESYAACHTSVQIDLKENYRDTLASLSLPLTNESFPISSFFTQLSIVSQVSQEEKEKDAQRRDPYQIERDSLRETSTRMCEVDKGIEIHTLFDPREGKSVQKILLQGRAGIGKSTLCQKIAFDWASDTLFKDKFVAIYYIKLRELKSWADQHPLTDLQNPDRWLSGAIALLCYQGEQQERILQEITSHAEKTLLLCDGWDEASEEVMNVMKRYFRNGKIKHILLTSRPGVTKEIHANFDLAVENMGFTHQQIETYTEKFFGHTKCEGFRPFLDNLRLHSNLFAIAHIPIQLQILCALWQQGEKEFPNSLTAMLAKVTEKLFVWEMGKGKNRFPKSQQRLLLEAVGEIALKGLQSKQLVIPSKLIQQALGDSKFDTLDEIDLITTGIIKGCGRNGEMCFIHLTYQEYSIARYISNLSEEKQRDFIQKYRYKPHFHLVIRMLAGSLWYDSEDINKLIIFFESLYSGHRDMIGSYQTELVLACLDECHNEKLESIVWEKYEIANFIHYAIQSEMTRDCLVRFMAVSQRAFMQILAWVQKENSSKEIEWLISCFGKCMRAEYVKNDSFATNKVFCFLERALNDKSKWLRKSAIESLSRVTAHVSKESIGKIVTYLQNALSDGDGSVCYSAVEALGEVAVHVDKESIGKIVAVLQKALNHEKSWVCKYAAKFLGRVATHADKESIGNIIASLQKALSDTDERGRRPSAAEALGTVAAHADKDSVDKIISSLQKAVSDEDDSVRTSAGIALGEVAAHVNKEVINEIVTFLQNAFVDEDSIVRSSAARALEQVVAHVNKEVIGQIITFLQNALGDEDSKVRSSTARALEKVAAYTDKESIDKIITSLQNVLSDEDSTVRKSAALALGIVARHVDDKESIGEIVTLLQNVLSDEDSTVRRSAALAFGVVARHVDDKESIGEIIIFLQNALDDEDRFVRSFVARALGQVAAHVNKKSIGKIVISIQNALCDEDIGVHCSAIQALGELASHADKESIGKITTSLQNALDDEDSYVRSVAAQTLGEVAVYVDKESIGKITTSLQEALSDRDEYVHRDATNALVAAVVYADKESIDKIVTSLQKTLSDEKERVRESAIKAIKSISGHPLLPIYLSESPALSCVKPLIFELFVNQSLPLYFIEEHSGCTIRTSDENFLPIDNSKINSVRKICMNHRLTTQASANRTNNDLSQEKCIIS